MNKLEDWQKPSPALKRMAQAAMPAHLRGCPVCHHRHMKGERCGYQLTRACACTS